MTSPCAMTAVVRRAMTAAAMPVVVVTTSCWTSWVSLAGSHLAIHTLRCCALCNQHLTHRHGFPCTCSPVSNAYLRPCTLVPFHAERGKHHAEESDSAAAAATAGPGPSSQSDNSELQEQLQQIRCSSQGRGSVYDSSIGITCHFCRQVRLSIRYDGR